MIYPEFETKEQKIDYIRKNKKAISEMKKSILKPTDCFGVSVFEKNVSKSVSEKAKKDDGQSNEDQILRTIIGNTYGWLDSHDDVHIPGIFTKSINERQKQIEHLHDHVFAVMARVGIPQKIYEQKVSWAELGVNRAGETTCLLMDSLILKDLNANVFGQYKRGEIKQHSVGMRYINLFLCINDPQDQEHYKNWLSYIQYVGNQEKAIEKGYFWAVTEASLREISAVIEGSNELTGVMPESESSQDTQENKSQESPEGTQEEINTTEGQEYKFVNINLI